ncbi:MAG: hydrogenase formation protein HypD [Fimbriimonadaceae bacterium]|nr:hydrogenase formation protein HypD [Fimbriimonadaceae bacterium]
MPSLEQYQSRDLVAALVREIERLAPVEAPVKIMHVCGSHEHSLSQWGLRSLLPPQVELIAGPGCPVCVCPEHEVREALAVARRGALLLTYGDMLRVPTSEGSLLDAAAQGADIKLVYSPADCVRQARENPGREVCFFAVGFETTAAPTAALVQAGPPANLSVLTAHRLTPPAMALLLRSGEIEVDALIAPGHVSVVIGAEAWRPLVTEFDLPCIVAGFEPVDLLLAVREILRQLRQENAALGNVYRRLVKPHGSAKAQAALARTFDVRPSVWRGLGELPDTGLLLQERFDELNARVRFDLRISAESAEMPAGCQCNRVMLGQIKPPECGLFRSACHPLRPYGPCMVSQEGTCYIWHQYGGQVA